MTFTKKNEIADFEVLFKKNFESFCSKVFVLVKDKDVAGDLVQQVFFKYWKNKQSIVVASSIEGYLYKACINEAHNYIKWEKRRLALNKEYSYSTASNSNNTEEQYQFVETAQKVESAIKELPPACKEVFLLSRFEEMNHKQIAEFLGISTNTVNNHIKKALKILKDHLLLLVLINTLFEVINY